VSASVEAAAVKPRLRGILHAVAFAASCVTGVLFISAAPGSRALPAAVFAASATVMLGTSALYHLRTWTPRARPWMRRADHAGIYLLIAGTYTPVGLIALEGTWRVIVLVIVWGGALLATGTKFFWVDAPKWMSAVIAIALGWVGVAAMPQLAQEDGIAPVILLAAGGLAYTAGGIVYALRRPNPSPAFFGYHEVFHALTIVALACQYVAIAFFVVRVG
jgi:hemolysin III